MNDFPYDAANSFVPQNTQQISATHSCFIMVTNPEEQQAGAVCGLIAIGDNIKNCDWNSTLVKLELKVMNEGWIHPVRFLITLKSFINHHIITLDYMFFPLKLRVSVKKSFQIHCKIVSSPCFSSSKCHQAFNWCKLKSSGEAHTQNSSFT